MGILNPSPTPQSKRDKTIPYSYEARVDLLHGEGLAPVPQSYFADTICGLVETLIEQGYAPGEVKLYGLYHRRQRELEVERCVGSDGDWLVPPELCHELEEYYRDTLDSRYRGHVENGSCMYEDRDRRGHGPY